MALSVLQRLDLLAGFPPYRIAWWGLDDASSVNPSLGSTAGTMVSVYYSKDPISGADSDCGSAPLWDGLLCKSYAGDLTAGGSGPGLVITKVNGYDYLGRAMSTTQTPSGDVGHARTTTTLYGFNSTVTGGVSRNPYANATTQTATSGGLGVALAGGQGYSYDAAGRLTQVPAQSVSYDSGTGLSTGLSDGSTGDASSYDDFGRLSSYTENTSAMGAQTNVTNVVFDPTSGRVTSRRDQHQRVTYAYNGGTEFRGLPTSTQVEVTATNNSTPALWSGTFTVAYDSDGRPVSQSDPNGIVSTLNRDEAGQLLQRADTRGGVAWLTDTVSKTIFGQNRTHAGPAGTQTYSYDAAGRLGQVLDTPMLTGVCSTRRYLFDANSNRLGLTSAVSADQTCAAGTAPSATIGYDDADRLLTAGTVYDSFGRTTTAPAGTVVGANLTAGYFANDLVASQSQGSTTQSWTLDQGQQRLRTATTVVSGSTTKMLTNHYDDAGSDSPVWIAETADGAGWTVNVTDALGSLAATVDQAGAVTFQYANLHGDVQGTSAAGAGAPTISPDVDEYGNTPTGSAVPRYGWLGGKQRSGEDQGGLLLMGVRLYNPLSGRFLQTDPVPGGSANAYDYSAQDPINKFDLDGRFWGGVSDWCAGFGDTVTFGGTKQIRRLINHELNGDDGDMVNHQSDSYRWGGHGGFLASFFDVGAGIGEGFERLGLRRGGEIITGRGGRRIAPLGGSKPRSWQEWLPHYHRRYPGPGGGIGRHRPWDSPVHGRSWWSRF